MRSFSPFPSHYLRLAVQLRSAFSPALCAAVLIASSGAARATSYYWDTNGVGMGAGQTPSGSWDGSTANFNTDSTGGNGTTTGTFVSTLGTGDNVTFVAGPTLTATGDTNVSGGNAYTVSVTGTETAGEIQFDSVGAMTIGASVGSGTIALSGVLVGSVVTGINGIRYTTGTTQVGDVIINSNLQLTADQTWVTSQVGTTPVLTINGAISGTSNLTIADSTSRTLQINGSMTQTGNLLFNGGNTVVNVTGNVANSGNVSLAFTAAGANVTLARAAGNSYTGTTTISGGTLVISNTSGSATSAGAVNLSAAGGVASAGILSGTGISTGLLTVTSNGQITPSGATSAGTIQLGTVGGVSLTSATLNLNLAATTAAASDKITTGALTLGSTLTVNLSEVGSTATALATTGMYTLITDTNGAALNLAGVTITTNFSGFTSTYAPTYSSDAAGDLLVSFTMVPEPSTLAIGLISLGLIGWMWKGRRIEARG